MMDDEDVAASLQKELSERARQGGREAGKARESER